MLPASKLLGYECSPRAAKLTYFRLNSQTVCPRRAAVSLTPSYTHENKRGDIVAKINASGAQTYQAQYK